MLKKDLQESSKSLLKINRVCKFINLVFKLILFVFSIYWLIAIGAMVFESTSFEKTQQISGVSAFQILLYALHGVVIALLIILLICIFSDATKGESPFTMSQVKRLRMIAGLLLAYAILDFLITQNNALLNYGQLDAGYISTSDSSIIQVNFGPLILAGAVFAFSFVFKYGVLLQEFSDETL